MEKLKKIIPLAQNLMSILPNKNKNELFANTLNNYVVKTGIMLEVQIGNKATICDGLIFKVFGDNYLSLSPYPLNGEEQKKWESIILLPSLKFASEVTSGKFSHVLNVSWKSKKHKYSRSWKFNDEKDLSFIKDFILKMRDEIYKKVLNN